MNASSEFWDRLAPHHAALENSYFDLPTVRRIIHAIHEPALIVGAGQGLIVAELRKRGIRCDGVDSSPEMIKYAKIRRGIDLVQADARAMPFQDGTYRTVLYATGVIDFMTDDEDIRLALNEGKRIADQSGRRFVAFYRMSAGNEEFLLRLGLLNDHVLHYREIMEIYRLNPLRAIAWAAKKGNMTYFRSAMWTLRAGIFSTWQEKRNAFRLQRVFTDRAAADILIQSAPEKQSYRNEAEIRNLFARLAIPIKQIKSLANCRIVEI